MSDYITLEDLEKTLKKLYDLKKDIQEEISSDTKQRDINFYVKFRGIKIIANFVGDFKDSTLEEANRLGFFIDERNKNFYIELSNSNLENIVDVFKKKYEQLKVTLRKINTQSDS